MLLIRAGKSILFMLLAVIQGIGISIVIILFIALVDNLVEQAQLVRVDYIYFKSSSRQLGQEIRLRVAQLVIVRVKIVIRLEFKVYIDKLVSLGQLGQIFLDKCYIVIIDQGYQAKLVELQGLYQFRQLVVMLIAILLVALEGQFQ